MWTSKWLIVQWQSYSPQIRIIRIKIPPNRFRIHFMIHYIHRKLCPWLYRVVFNYKIVGNSILLMAILVSIPICKIITQSLHSIWCSRVASYQPILNLLTLEHRIRSKGKQLSQFGFVSDIFLCKQMMDKPDLQLAYPLTFF